MPTLVEVVNATELSTDPFIKEFKVPELLPLDGNIFAKPDNTLESTVASIILLTEVPADGIDPPELSVVVAHIAGDIPSLLGKEIVFPVNPEGAGGAGLICIMLFLISVSSVAVSEVVDSSSSWQQKWQ